jgi:hypothetical protein
MVNVNELINGIADTISFPRKSAAVYGRVAREAGHLSQFGRGRHAAEAAPQDAAALTIALVACPSPARAPEYIRDFGDLVCGHVATQSDKQSKSVSAVLFGERHTFRQDLSNLIACLGKPSFAELVVPTLRRPQNGVGLLPSMMVTIRDTTLSADIYFQGLAALYGHKSIYDEDPKRAALERSAAEKKYFRGVRSERAIDGKIIEKIAACVNGISFQELLADARDPAQIARGYSDRIGDDGWPIDERHPANRKR